MARPERHDADYFPFYAKNGKTLFILQSHYGLSGIGFFTNLMRLLTVTPDHHLSIADEADRLYFFSQIGCTEEEGVAMLELMSKTGKIDKKLFDVGIIFSNDLLESLHDAYRNRTNNAITAEEIHKAYGFLTQETPKKASVTHKGKERKLKDTKLNYSDEFLEFWEYYPRKVNKKGAYKAWCTLMKKEVDREVFDRAVTNYVESVRGKDETYIMHPSTFLGPNERWRDYE